MKTLHAALAGNPNVGKSTVFNGLTGLRQHTGNWPGKTVEKKTGAFTCGCYEIRLTDLPGTYSLDAHSPEEAVTGMFLRGEEAAEPDCIAVVCDGGTLSRNLILALQILSHTGNVVLCVNLMDEAARRGITVDTDALSAILGCPVIPCTARQKVGLDPLCDAICQVGDTPPMPPKTFEAYGRTFAEQAENIAAQTVHYSDVSPHRRETVLDRIFTGRTTAYPVMALLVLAVFWLTVRGAGILSGGLETFFSWLLPFLRDALGQIGLGEAPVSFLADGILATLTQVIAVMLPPMAVFFPLFTLLEDFGYLPRAAFVLDRMLSGCGACGKQALTMLMGLGCNAAGVTGCRIIDSPRERKLAMLTNCFMPCNGRLPMVIFLTSALVFLGSGTEAAPGLQAVLLGLAVLLCTGMTFAACRVLSLTLLKGAPSAFTLELPPYRIPQVGQVLVRSVLDRTVLVLGRAVSVAAPAGGVLWILSHVYAGGQTLYSHLTAFLDPAGRFFGMDGVILTAFFLSLPAAEIFLPLVLAGYAQTGGSALAVLLDQGWNGVTVLCVLWFTLFHWPCSTTILTIRKECGSWRWTVFAAVLPTLLGLAGCALIRWGAAFIGYWI